MLSERQGRLIEFGKVQAGVSNKTDAEQRELPEHGRYSGIVQEIEIRCFCPLENLFPDEVWGGEYCLCCLWFELLIII